MDLTYSARDALAVGAGNPARTWGGNGDGTARARLTGGGFLSVRHRPKFAIDARDTIFTIGSCFARNVEAILGLRGFPLALQGHGIEPEFYESFDEETGVGGGVATGAISRSAFNKYTVHSISHELRRILRDEAFENEGLIELGQDRWFDPHASGLKHLPLDQALALRRRVHAAMSTIRGASVVFMTLGLTEGWIDTATGLAMNRHPGVPALKRHGTRFQFVDHGFAEIQKEMTEAIALIREVCNPDMRFIVTVSPVPLGATWRETDIVVANSASKSTLRAVAEDLRRRFDHVDYFPSYEIVTNSPREMAWAPDQLHVAWPMVQHIMGLFQKAYMPAREESAP